MPKHGTREAEGHERVAFAETFTRAVAKLRRLGRGCLYCSTGQCYTGLSDKLSLLQQWRREYNALPNDAARDQHLSWMFWHHGAGQGLTGEGGPAAPAPKRQRTLPTRCPTSDEESKGGAEQQKAPTTEEAKSDGDPRSLRPAPARDPTSDEPQEVPGFGRARDPTSTSGRESDLDVACRALPAPRTSAGAPEQPRARAGRPRQMRFHVMLLGTAICQRAALRLIGVGQSRLHRIKHGSADGRRDGAKAVRGSGRGTATMTRSVLRFLWRLYHSVGEGMPDKFNFKKRDVRTLVVEVRGSTQADGAKDKGLAVVDEESDARSIAASASPSADEVRDPEEEERSVTAAVLYAETARLPPEAAQSGPGMLRGPLRFLPPTRRVHLYWEYAAWCTQHDAPTASFHTFLRTFHVVRDKLRIRKAGTHATCDECIQMKLAIRRARFPKERQRAIEVYTHHCLNQWLDRQASHCCANVWGGAFIGAGRSMGRGAP
jgi:hypothetical protein